MLDEFCVLDRSTTISCGSFLICDLSTRDIRMRSKLQHNQITHAQTVDDNLNDVSAGTHGVEADFSEGDMLASLEVVLHWLGSAVARSTSMWGDVGRCCACCARTPRCSTSSLVGVPSRGRRRRQLPKPPSLQSLFFA